MLLAILNICSQEELSGSEVDKELNSPVVIVPESAEDMTPEQRRQIIKNKVLAIGKISRTFSVLRENSELVMELKNLSGTGKLPTGTLGLGSEGIRKGRLFLYKMHIKHILRSYFFDFFLAITTFEEARRSDIENERLPPGSRESMDAIHQKNTSSKLRYAEDEQDESISRMADVISSVPERASRSSRSAKSQV